MYVTNGCFYVYLSLSAAYREGVVHSDEKCRERTDERETITFAPVLTPPPSASRVLQPLWRHATANLWLCSWPGWRTPPSPGKFLCYLEEKLIYLTRGEINIKLDMIFKHLIGNFIVFFHKYIFAYVFY